MTKSLRLSAGRKALAITLDVATFGVLILMVTMAWRSYRAERVQPPKLTSRRNVNADLHGLMNAVRGSNVNQTVIAALSPECGACKKDLPFLQKLIATVSAHPGTELVLAFPITAQNVVADFVATNGLAGAKVKIISFRQYGISQVPALAIGDRDGNVPYSSVGSTSELEQESVLARLAK